MRRVGPQLLLIKRIRGTPARVGDRPFPSPPWGKGRSPLFFPSASSAVSMTCPRIPPSTGPARFAAAARFTSSRAITSPAKVPIVATLFRLLHIKVAVLSVVQHHHERLPTVLEKHPKDAEMHDPAIARSIIVETYDLERNGRARVIAAAFEGVTAVERQIDKTVLALRRRKWTERRVRAIVDHEAARIDNYEIDDLQKAAIAEARRELNRSRQRASRMAAFLAHRDADFHGDEIERMGAFARGVDMPGVVRGGAPGGDDPDEFSG